MQLDKNLTAQQLWTIAADAEHRSADLLDDLVDHPSSYRALSDWAVAGLAMTDLRALPLPPEPEGVTETQKRGLRLSSVLMSTRRREVTSQTYYPETVSEQEGVDAWLAAAPTPSAASLVPALTVDPPRFGDTKRPWFRRPAPMGLVIVILVLQILMLMAVVLIARREAVPAVAEGTRATVAMVEAEGGTANG